MAKQASWGIEVKGITRLKGAMKVLGETDAPFLRDAVEQGGNLLEDAVKGRAGSLAGVTSMTGVKGAGAAVRALVVVKDGRAKAVEFGRTTYYRGYTGRKQKATGQKFKSSKGQKARPFVGIKKADQAIGSVAPQVVPLIAKAFEKEWERLAEGPD